MMVRATLLFTISILLAMAAASRAFAQRDIETEHRFTKLETNLASLSADMAEIKRSNTWQLWSLCGLSAITGVGTMKKRRGE